jgi:predicted aspartyl protease
MRRLVRFGGLLTAAVALSFGASAVTGTSGGDIVPVYRLKLGPFVAAPTRMVGLIVKVRINGGPPLRLLLDSGANTITLDSRAAAKSSCAGGVDLDLVGAGAQAATVVKQTRADRVEIGDFVLRDLPVLISDRIVAEGIQGVLPLSVFSAFLIRLDVPRKTLDLLPYPAASPNGSENLQALSSNSLLFVRGTVNEQREGYFLLDTGASYSAVSTTVARELTISQSLAERVPLQAGTTELDAPLVGSSVRLRFGSRELGAGRVVAIDLSLPARYHNFDIAGLLGFPALSGSVLLVNYRDGLVRIDSR